MPHEWFESVTPADVWAAVLALGLILTVVLVLFRWVYPMVSKALRVFDLFLGRPADGVLPRQVGIAELILGREPAGADPGSPSMVQRFDAVEDRLKAVEQQVTPNHGSTNKLSEDVQDLKEAVGKLHEQLEQHLNKPPRG